MNNGDLAAFPSENEPYSAGMTKRELIAMHLMGATIANPDAPAEERSSLASRSVEIADALLAELATEVD